jgi:hypothetical protein
MLRQVTRLPFTVEQFRRRENLQQSLQQVASTLDTAFSTNEGHAILGSLSRIYGVKTRI